MGFLRIITPIFLLFGPVASPAQAGTPAFKRAMIIVLENTNYKEAMQQPFFSKIAKNGALFTQFIAEAHPSQPNYIAMIAGDTMRVKFDNPVDINGTHVGNLLAQKGLSWKVYAEDLPSQCYLGEHHGKYVRRHVPFISFLNVQKDPNECAKIVNATTLGNDIATNQVPAFSMVIPNLDHDGHDTNPATSSQWLGNAFGPLFADPNFMRDTLVVITFDESETYIGRNRIYTVFLGANVIPGSQVATPTTHYSVLRTIEDQFGLGTLGRHDAQSAPITGIWQ